MRMNVRQNHLAPPILTREDAAIPDAVPILRHHIRDGIPPGRIVRDLLVVQPPANLLLQARNVSHYAD